MEEDNEIKRGLISKKSSNFDKLYEEGLVKIQRIKQKNDMIQKQISADMQDSVQNEIADQKQYIEKQIGELKNIMQQIQAKFKDPQSKNKLKNLKAESQKQIQRNKFILKDFNNQSFVRRSRGNRRPQEQDEPNSKQASNKAGPKRSSLITEEQIQIDYQIERKIMLQKNELINQVEQSTNRINAIVNDMGVMVEDQGQNMDLVTDHLANTAQNVTATNENLVDANELQQKARRKYIILVSILLLIVLAVAGIIFIVAT